jgi:electron transport complex protein RnfB
VTPADTLLLAERVDAALPQTQCTRCGYADCRGYAQAVAQGEANINQCPPGGAEGIARLAAITGRDTVALNPAHGSEGPRKVMFVDEAWCIGCTLCIKACPVDCIVGAPQRMHTIVESLCTGCELCLPVCPVDCIAVEDATPGRSGWDAWSAADADRARARHAARNARLAREAAAGDSAIESAAAAALARVRARRVPA